MWYLNFVHFLVGCFGYATCDVGVIVEHWSILGQIFVLKPPMTCELIVEIVPRLPTSTGG